MSPNTPLDESSTAAEQARSDRPRVWTTVFGPIVALYSYAVAWPVLNLLQTAPPLFVSRQVYGLELICLVLIIALLPPMVLGASVIALQRLDVRLGRRLLLVLVTLFCGLLALQLISRILPVPFAVAIGLAVGLAAAGCAIFARSAAARGFLAASSLASVAFLGFLLVLSPIAPLVVTTGDALPRAASAGGSNAPVVFVLLDELPTASLLTPTGQIDQSRYPHLSRFAETASWYRNATSVSPLTFEAVPALLSGLDPKHERLPVHSEYPGSLFTAFSDYEQNVQEPFTDLCPPSVCTSDAEDSPPLRKALEMIDIARTAYARILAPQLFTSEDTSVEDPYGLFTEAESASHEAPKSSLDRDELVAHAVRDDEKERFDEFLGGITGRDAQLNFVHLFLPHAPFTLLPSGTAYTNATELPGQDEERWADDWLADVAAQRHLLQAAYVDELLGSLVARLESLDRFNETAIVIVADHGISFRHGQPRRGATTENAFDIGMVPAFIKAPGQTRAQIFEHPFSAVDVLPTLAGLLHRTLSWSTDGQSALEAPRRTVRMPGLARDLSAADLSDGLLGSVATLSGLVQLGEGDEGLFRFGPYQDLHGADPSLSQLGVSRADAMVRVQDSSAFTSVQRRSSLPARLQAEVDGLSVSDTVAVGLNERIVSTGPVIKNSNGRLALEVMLPESSFREGANALRFFRVSRDRVLQPIPSNTDLRATLTAKTLTTSLGERFQLDSDKLTGAVDSAGGDQDRVVLSGWAIQRQSGEPASHVFLFVDGEFVARSRPQFPRVKLAAELALPAAKSSGWSLSIPRHILDEARDVHFLAVAQGSATSLQPLPSVVEAAGLPFAARRS
jgi:hypothetical protein